MAAQLSSHKRVLTRHCNKLETVLARFKDEQLEIAPNLEELREGGSEEDYRRRLHEALGALEACTSKIERLWQEYAYAVDNIGEIEKSEKDDFEVYSDKIEVVLGSTLDYTDQRVLLEQLQIIMSQLRDKGEQVDSQWLLKQVLAKFPERVQRRVLERKYSMEGSFRMDDLLMCLDKIVSMEEKIALHTSKGSGDDGTLARRDKYPRKEAERVNFQCMYCGGDHKATSCTKFGTPKERS
ncbi:hypothetical protein OSTOST_17206, partial [Ostertagia ostertagi]